MLRKAKEAAKEAGKILFKHFNSQLKITHKGPHDLVCEIDMKAERKAIAIIQKKYPDHQFVCEEQGSFGGPSRYTWLVDALDGTINYIHGIPFFCASIGVLKDKKPFIGVVYDPLRDELYYAQKGCGAYLNGTRVHVSGQRKLSEAMLCTDLSTHKEHHKRFMQVLMKISPKIMGVRVLNATSLNLAMVASGKFDFYFKNIMQYEDGAPGGILIEEAGGKVSSFQSAKLSKKSKTMLACNPHLHKLIVPLLK